MPTHFALIHLCGVMDETDFLGDCTRTLDALGIDGANPQELKSAIA